MGRAFLIGFAVLMVFIAVCQTAPVEETESRALGKRSLLEKLGMELHRDPSPYYKGRYNYRKYGRRRHGKRKGGRGSSSSGRSGSSSGKSGSSGSSGKSGKSGSSGSDNGKYSSDEEMY